MPSPFKFEPASIYKVNNYIFDDDNSVRDKYLIVLHINQEELFLINTLTTTNKRTGKQDVFNGCNSQDGFHFYFFQEKHEIGKEKFFFDKNTYIFFYKNIRKQPISKYDEHIKNSSIMKLDSLTDYEYGRLLKCILKTKHITPDIKKELAIVKEGISN